MKQTQMQTHREETHTKKSSAHTQPLSICGHKVVDVHILTQCRHSYRHKAGADINILYIQQESVIGIYDTRGESERQTHR